VLYIVWVAIIVAKILYVGTAILQGGEDPKFGSSRATKLIYRS
jgi:hypothetical protein